MAHYIGVTKTQRNQLPYNRIPTVRVTCMAGLSRDRYDRETYDKILDCVYEMTDMVSTSNGIPLERALYQVLKDEDWYILPSHKDMILAKLKE